MELAVVSSTYQVRKKGVDKDGNTFFYDYKSDNEQKPNYVSVEIYEGEYENGILCAGCTFNSDGTMTLNVIKFTPTTFAQTEVAKQVAEGIFAEFE